MLARDAEHIFTGKHKATRLNQIKSACNVPFFCCIANNILRDYLKRKTKEVLNMLLAEYDYATDIAVQQHLDYYESLEHGQLSNIRALYNYFAHYL